MFKDHWKSEIITRNHLWGTLKAHFLSGLKSSQQDFPGGSLVKNLPANAGDTNSIPDPGRSHTPWGNYSPVPQLLSCTLEPGNRHYRARAHVLHLLKSWSPRARALQQEKPLQWEACTPQLESSPRWLQLEKSPWGNEDPVQPKINKLIKLCI